MILRHPRGEFGRRMNGCSIGSITSGSFRSWSSAIRDALIVLAMVAGLGEASYGDNRPNILFAIADDWGWPHAGAYGDQVVQTPNFDRIAAEGALFQNAFVSSPSCTPSRNAILTGQYHWRLGSGANLWSRLDTRHATYPRLLQEAGYFVGHWRKSWGPGKLDNWPQPPAGPSFEGFEAFLEQRPADKPFCFWLGASDPHRPYKAGSGKESGLDLTKVHLFSHFPDVKAIRSDVADYYFEVQRFDQDVGKAIAVLERRQLLDDTWIVITGDHGMPFPRCKSNCYDSGVRVPLAIRWPEAREGVRGATLEDFVSLTDLAPTFLVAGGIDVPKTMTGQSLQPLLIPSDPNPGGQRRSRVFFGKERHTIAQEAPDRGGTPMRAIRTHEFLLIRNYRPDRWPAGTPNWKQATRPGAWLSDCDNGPTKSYIVQNKDRDATHRRSYDLCFAKRPEYELYDVKGDPNQTINVADRPEFQATLAALKVELDRELAATGDPRAVGRGDEVFDSPEYFGGAPQHPHWAK